MAKRETLVEVLLDRKKLREDFELANKRMETLTWQATQDRDAARDAIVEQASAESRERSLRGELEGQQELVVRLRRLEQELYREKADLRQQLAAATQRSVEGCRQHQAERAEWRQEREILRSVIRMLAGRTE
jgi:hypothetical protein